MLYIYFGSDINKSQLAWRKFAEAVKTKRPDAEVFELAEDIFSETSADELLHGQGLFVSKHIVLAKRLLQNQEAEQWLFDNLKDISEADHMFLLWEEKLLAPQKQKLEKFGAELKEFIKKPEAEIKDNFIFSIGDALGARDRLKLWKAVAGASLKGYEPEEIFWQLFGTARNMALVAREESDQDIPLHPFVAKKTRGYLRNWGDEGALKLTGDLMALYHNVRRESRDLDVALERFALEI
ncbi:MAG: hypothetical protein A2571_00825 [Candidatus Vogelbacteria bacterium RIFOXYD1_FULL_44_32]|uniref:DNA polymerase III delta N-terminal domain-containing protein n=1 Tax=Candidatus Vogelbacteria bacterium RIFOXYD1_FULL_44_32 TaxID=1802438 RepID=A0A1G2QFS6_9BACT|nr:MAG: hypothetical protein A2571_00825 [Candidatus Vogelbacteria bacterium RIFOXYD1_FULL_44_32]